MIPKLLHFCFGLSPDFGRKQWSLVHYACIKSAIERIRPDDVFFYYEYEPSGPWWELTRGLVTLQKISAPREIFGNPLLHPAHRADVVRLQALLRKGGIYLDCDVFVHRSFDDLLQYRTVMGEQRREGTLVGLCNAVILSEPEAPFLQNWYSRYRTFRSRGRDEFWDEHSVKLPSELSQTLPQQVTVLPESAFFLPSCDPSGLRAIYASKANVDLSTAYATHLWEALAWDEYLKYLSPKRVRHADTNFHRWVRPMIEGLSDDYGAPARAARALHRIRLLQRRARAILRVGSRFRDLIAVGGNRAQPEREGLYRSHAEQSSETF
jgi:hypothetical protein